VGKHRLAGHVADGEDARPGGAAPAIHADEALVVELDPGSIEAEPLGQGSPLPVALALLAPLGLAPLVLLDRKPKPQPQR
jgi:hypothetical protein